MILIKILAAMAFLGLIYLGIRLVDWIDEKMGPATHDDQL